MSDKKAKEWAERAVDDLEKASEEAENAAQSRGLKDEAGKVDEYVKELDDE